MKSMGIVRKLDQLGRIVLPKELRDNLEFEENQPLEIFVKGDLIVLKKHKPGCHCCGSYKVEAKVLGISLCRNCINEFNNVRKKVEEIRKGC